MDIFCALRNINIDEAQLKEMGIQIKKDKSITLNGNNLLLKVGLSNSIIKYNGLVVYNNYLLIKTLLYVKMLLKNIQLNIKGAK